MAKITSNKTANGEMEWLITEDLTLVAAVSFSRPANTTAYSIKDVVNVALALTAATNASPIVCTTAAHGLADGDPITIAGVVGNTNANGNFFAKVTGYSTLTFALYSDKALTTPVAGNGAWSSGGILARIFRLPNIFSENGGCGLITKVRARTNLSTFVDQFKIHFYDAPITALADNSVFTLLWANSAAHLGEVTMPAFATEGTGSDSASSTATLNSNSGLALAVRNGDNTRDLYFRIEDLSAGTPASGQSFYIEVSVMEG